MNKKYFGLQVKRVLKSYPSILIVTLATFLGIAIVCAMLLVSDASKKEKQRITIGIVGNTEESYFGIGLTALKEMDDSSFYVDWKELTEKDAKEALRRREISGYLYIPERYIESVFYGENNSAKYVVSNAPEGFGTIISEEIAEDISDIVTESQVGMVGMQDLAMDYNMENFEENQSALMLKYIDLIVNRNETYEVKNLGVADSLSMVGYYVSGLIIFFVLLWGISCNKIFASRNNEYSRLLNISGVKARQQVLCEYGAYLIITLITLFVFAIIFGIALQFVKLDAPELKGLTVIECVLFIIKILPVIVMITLMQMMVYELISNRVAAVLMQFILTVVLGYFSGCFYPSYFFPEALQKIAAALPVGAGFSYVRCAMTGWPALLDFALVIGYAAAFFALVCSAKRCKVTGDAR